jgi:hypothetical protein
MKLGHIKKLAAVSVVALSTAMYAGDVMAVQSGVATPVTTAVTVDNTIDVVVTPLNFGRFAAVRKTADAASSILAPGAVTLPADTGVSFASARIVPDTATPPSTATVTITAFPSTIMYIDYHTVVDLTEAGSGDVVKITNIVDNLAAPTTGTGGVNGSWDSVAAEVQGYGTTAAITGILAFNVGGTITTDQTDGDAVYANGTYNGSFQMTVSY